MTCPYCGSQLRPGFSTCPSCGATSLGREVNWLGYVVMYGLIAISLYLWAMNFGAIEDFFDHILDKTGGAVVALLGFGVVPVLIMAIFFLVLAKLNLFKRGQATWTRGRG